MKGYLLDTNVASELRKGRRADPNVSSWVATVEDDELFLSVLMLGEIRKGIEIARRRDEEKARALERWLSGLELRFGERLLPIDSTVAEHWGRLAALRPVSVIDLLMAATALANDLMLVTRNARDVEHTGVRLVNPFA